jgi:hypothetical protein
MRSARQVPKVAIEVSTRLRNNPFRFFNRHSHSDRAASEGCAEE